MPKLGVDTRTTKLYLPSTKDEPNEADRAFVVIRSKLRGGNIVDISEMEGGNILKGLAALTFLIESWNYTEDGTPNSPMIPISEDSIRKLDDDDFGFLSEWALAHVINKPVGLTDEQKKSSMSTSPTSLTDTIPPTTASQPTMTPSA